MTWGISAQRRADEFDALVEASSTGASSAPDARDADLLALVGALRAAPEPQPRPEFVAGLRERLMAEAETALAPTDLSRLRLPARHTRRERRIAALVGGLAVVGATTSIAVASQSALPGESLYPIKRIIESAHSGLSLNDATKGRVHLASASRRLDEVSALTQDPGRGDDQRIADTLSAFASQATSGADLMLSDYADTGNASSISDLRDWAAASLDRLVALEPEIPYSAHDELVAAAAVLSQIDSSAEQACPACGGTPIDGVPPPLQSAEHVVVPTNPATQPAQANGQPGRSGDQADPSSAPTPDLPDPDQTLPPGSVLDPGSVPSTDPSAPPNPIQSLADALTGQGTGTSQPSAPTGSPVADAVTGLGDILHGVLDPITGQVVPSDVP